MTHAPANASGADNWFSCPAYIKENADKPRETSLPAATGTLIHSMTEMLLKGRLIDVGLREYWLGRTEVVEDFEIDVDESMVDCAEIYVDYILKRQKELNATKIIEEKLYINEISDKCYGTADCILIAEDRICVIDLKSGKWPVEAVKNKQLMIYGLGALTRYGQSNPDITVELTIVQPRVKNPIKTFEISAPNLVNWGFTDLKEAIDACFEENPRYAFGKQCKFCKAKSYCDEYKRNSGG